ncbi:uncharacterized protein LOC133815797 [Humulus lupulus]|uniref:uncharacterized protein LOC133815797 n=1 Tax=Humulus lupulus TaxID=3486 RepID=UPI002B416699|nr:uncharacterized protein LOC133815797 [Humulus lupulus]
MKGVENNHWILAVIHCQKGCASVWDSVSGRYRTRVRTHILSELLKKLDVLLHTTMGSARVGGPVFSLFSVVPSGQVPQQDNGHDCGVFVMKFMEWIVDGESPPKSYKVEDAARLDIAIDILTCESNRLRLGVKDNAATYYKACLSSVEKSPDLKNGLVILQKFRLYLPCYQRKRLETNTGPSWVRERGRTD